MSKRISTILIIILLLVGLTAYYFSVKYSGETSRLEQTNQEKDWTLLGAPTFEWTYTPFEKDFIPYNVVSLTATYFDSTTRIKEIDTIEGGCNEYVNPDKDVYSKSVEIICYYAGFGRYYKVVEDGKEYLVKRKEFEEGSPEYNPPIQDFMTIEKF